MKIDKLILCMWYYTALSPHKSECNISKLRSAMGQHQECSTSGCQKKARKGYLFCNIKCGLKTRTPCINDTCRGYSCSSSERTECSDRCSYMKPLHPDMPALNFARRLADSMW